jgi:hypothetical protein
MPGTGTAEVDFGSAPGTNIAGIAVTGQAAILATSHVEAWMMGTDATATHNAYEHAVVPLELHLAITALTAGVGFTISAITRLRLTGTFLVHWVWS